VLLLLHGAVSDPRPSQRHDQGRPHGFPELRQRRFRVGKVAAGAEPLDQSFVSLTRAIRSPCRLRARRRLFLKAAESAMPVSIVILNGDHYPPNPLMIVNRHAPVGWASEAR
jgi:hypothetical protein